MALQALSRSIPRVALGILALPLKRGVRRGPLREHGGGVRSVESAVRSSLVCGSSSSLHHHSQNLCASERTEVMEFRRTQACVGLCVVNRCSIGVGYICGAGSGEVLMRVDQGGRKHGPRVRKGVAPNGCAEVRPKRCVGQPISVGSKTNPLPHFPDSRCGEHG